MGNQIRPLRVLVGLDESFVLWQIDRVSTVFNCTGPGKNNFMWLRECCRQVEAKVVSNSRNQLHQTTHKYYFRAQYGIEGIFELSCDISIMIHEGGAPLEHHCISHE